MPLESMFSSPFHWESQSNVLLSYLPGSEATDVQLWLNCTVQQHVEASPHTVFSPQFERQAPEALSLLQWHRCVLQNVVLFSHYSILSRDSPRLRKAYREYSRFHTLDDYPCKDLTPSVHRIPMDWQRQCCSVRRWEIWRCSLCVYMRLSWSVYTPSHPGLPKTLLDRLTVSLHK